MTHENTTEQPVDGELMQASRQLAHALVASHKELNARWMYEMDREDLEICIQEGEMFAEDGKNLKVQLFHTQKKLAEIMNNTRSYWVNALTYMDPQYREKALQVQQVMTFANELILQSADPMSLLAAIHDPFSSRLHRVSRRFDAWETLPGILLVREYTQLSPEKQKELLETRGAWVRIIMNSEEDRKMKAELSVPYYDAFADNVAGDILTGRLQLPEVPEI